MSHIIEDGTGWASDSSAAIAEPECPDCEKMTTTKLLTLPQNLVGISYELAIDHNKMLVFAGGDVSIGGNLGSVITTERERTDIGMYMDSLLADVVLTLSFVLSYILVYHLDFRVISYYS